MPATKNKPAKRRPQSSRPEAPEAPDAERDSQREVELLGVVDHLLRVHQEWIEGPEQYLTDVFEEAVLTAVETYGTGALPNDYCREMAFKVNRLAEEWRKFEEYGSRANPTPRDGFWAALEAISEFRTVFNEPPKTLEPIELLANVQKVPHRQIALIYGWFLPNGVPDEQKVREELAQPGRHVGPDFIPPEERKRRERLANAVDQRRRLLDRREHQEVSAKFKPAPESVEELLRQNVTIRQIAEMKGISQEEVVKEAKRLGIKANEGGDIRSQRGTFERPLTDAENLAMDAKGMHPKTARAEAPEDDDEDLDEDDADDDGDAEDGGETETIAGPAQLVAEVLRLKGQGYTNAQIAEVTGRSVSTVKRVVAESKASAQPAAS